MTRRVPFILAVLNVLFASVSMRAAEKPNIVIILADDMGYGDPGCYNKGSKCPTPHIDSLARDGMRFTDAHSAGSWCTPSRYGLLTGRYAFRTSLAWRSQPVIANDVSTIANVLQDAGYATAMVGKWHLGFENGAQADFTKDLLGGPCDRGFSTYFGLPASLDIPDYFWIVNRAVPKPPTIRIEDSNSDGWSPVQGRFWRGGLRGPDFVMEEVLDRIGKEADNRITELAKSDDPFFLYIPLTSPHTPWLPSDAYKDADGAGMYSQFVAHTDAVVGSVLDSINRNGQSKNTLVIFTSDNGPVWYRYDVDRFQHDSTGGLRGMKGDVWEAGHRIPFLVRWPGVVPSNAVCNELISFVDVHATLAAVAGTKRAGSALDSLNLVDLWTGKSSAGPRKELICFQEPIAIRSGSWKLVNRRGSAGFLSNRRRKNAFLDDAERTSSNTDEKTPPGQLYDLSNDLAETKNLWNEKPQLVARLKKRLAEIADN